MQSFNRKFGVSDFVLFPMFSIDGSIIQTSADFSVGDVMLTLENGQEIVSTNLPIDVGSAFKLILTEQELSYKSILVAISDKTIPKQWFDTTIYIETY